VTKRKIAITIDEDLYDVVVRLAVERDESVSAWISEAARLQAANAELGVLIDEFEAEHGRITPEEVQAVHKPWQPRKRGMTGDVALRDSRI
jgi:hypothetical protein